MENEKKRKDIPKSKSEYGIPKRAKFNRVQKHTALFSSPNVKGVLVSCDQNSEDRSVGEVIALFNKYAEELYPVDTTSLQSNEQNEDTKEESTKEADKESETKESTEEHKEKLKSESTEEKQPKQHKFPKRFHVIDSGCKGHIFVCIKDERISPTVFVHQILSDPQLPQRAKNILIPAERVCKGELKEILETLQPLIDIHFKQKQNPTSFAVMFNSRNNSRVTRQEIIENVARSIGHPHKVNLNSPEQSVIVEVFKSACALSVVTDFFKLYKYNIQTVISNANTDGQTSSSTQEKSVVVTDNQK